MIPEYEYCLRPTKMNDSYYRIVKANTAARKAGVSYGRYMAGLYDADKKTRDEVSRRKVKK